MKIGEQRLRNFRNTVEYYNVPHNPVNNLPQERTVESPTCASMERRRNVPTRQTINEPCLVLTNWVILFISFL